MRISDWSSDVCSSDLRFVETALRPAERTGADVEAAAVESRHRETEAVTLGADEIFDGHAAILEDHLRRGGCVPAQLLGSDERRVGKEGVSTLSSWWSPYT